MRVKVEINTYERTTASDVYYLWLALTDMKLYPE